MTTAMTLTDLFDLALARSASDLHLVAGEPPRLRIAGELVPIEEPIDLFPLLEGFLTSESRARLASGLPAERTVVHARVAFVGLVFRAGDDSLVATFRVLGHGIPELEAVAGDALPLFERLATARKGFALIVGTTGSGKWTTACALADRINRDRAARILVVEAHPNYRFESHRGLVTALHVGADVDGYERALGLVNGIDANVVVLDDLPTLEALRLALSLAEMNVLVLANLHANTPVEAVERLLETAGGEAPALRRALADRLLTVTAQRLVPTETGRVAQYEWLAGSVRVRTALIAGEDLGQAQREDPESRASEAV